MRILYFLQFVIENQPPFIVNVFRAIIPDVDDLHTRNDIVHCMTQIQLNIQYFPKHLLFSINHWHVPWTHLSAHYTVNGVRRDIHEYKSEILPLIFTVMFATTPFGVFHSQHIRISHCSHSICDLETYSKQ